MTVFRGLRGSLPRKLGGDTHQPMAKVWRRKRKGKEIGSFHVLVGGKPVNLGTQNAREANARARLALAGQWPPDGESDVDEAAAVAARMEHADAVAPPAPPVPPVEIPPAPPTASASPAGNSCPVVGGQAEVDPVAAASAAASDASGDTQAVVDDVAEMRSALRELVSGQTAGGEPVDLGELVAAMQLSVERAVASMVVARMKPPRVIPEPETTGLAFRLLTIGWRCQLRRWESVLDNVTPAHLIVAGTLASIAGLVASAKPIPKPDPAAQPSSPVQADAVS